MASSPNPVATELWYSALHSDRGWWVTTPNKTQLLQLLYKTRKQLEDPALARITIRTSPSDPNGEVWLVKLPSDSSPT